MKRIIEIIRRLRKTENNAAFEFDNAAFEFDYAHSTAVAASSMQWFRLRSTTTTRLAASSRGLRLRSVPVGCVAGSSRGLSGAEGKRGLRLRSLYGSGSEFHAVVSTTINHRNPLSCFFTGSSTSLSPRRVRIPFFTGAERSRSPRLQRSRILFGG